MKRILVLIGLIGILTGCVQPAAEPQWWEDGVHAEALRQSGITGEGVLVAVLDSGLSDHPDFKRIEVTEVAEDRVGHGTFVTGLLADLMPGAAYLPIKITDHSTDIAVSDIVEGLRYAIERKADVAVLSLGLTEDVPELREAVQALADTVCLIFAAVGNDGTEALYYPAAYGCVFGVGACNLAFEPSETSQYNESVFVLAPGVKITGPWLDGGYQTLKGTSYAVPLAAAMGVAAKSRRPEVTPETFAALLQTSTTDVCDPGYDTQSGWGIIDFAKLCGQLSAAGNGK